MSDRLPINEERNSYSAALGYRTDNAFYTLKKMLWLLEMEDCL